MFTDRGDIYCTNIFQIFLNSDELLVNVLKNRQNRHFARKSKLWSKVWWKVEIFGKTRNIRQKSKYSLKIEIVIKNRNSKNRKIFVKNGKICPNRKIPPKIKIFHQSLYKCSVRLYNVSVKIYSVYNSRSRLFPL